MIRLVTSLVLSAAFVFGADVHAAGKDDGTLMAPYQKGLLELAYSGVSEIPLRPHIKNRSRAQLKVARACLELNNPSMAETFVADIQNWERWMGYADIAAYYAEQGLHDQSQNSIDKVLPALRMSEDIRSGKVAVSTPNPLIDTLVDRRYEAVLTRVEEVQRLNRDSKTEKALDQQFGEVNAAGLNAGILASQAASTADAIAALKPFTSHDNFEIAYFGFHELAKVADRYYDTIDLSRILNEDVKPRLTKVPVFLQIDLYLEFAGVAMNHDDVEAVMPILEELETMVAGLESRPRYYIPESARVLKLMIDVQQVERAGVWVDELMAYYNGKRDVITNIERAGLVCSLAEVYHKLGKADVVLDLYSRAVAEGTVNPNSRPQADDLNRICCSLALNEVEPNEVLQRQLREMRNGLGDPW